jgi:hypothetical protein
VIGRGNGFGSLNSPKLAGIKISGVCAGYLEGLPDEPLLIMRDQFQSFSSTARRRVCNCFDRDLPTI